MLRHIVVLAVAACCLSAAQPIGPKAADESFLRKQKIIYDLLWHEGASEEVYSNMEKQAIAWDIRANMALYTNKVAVEEFLMRYEQGMLPRGEIFSVFYSELREEAIALFHLFYYAKDFETFYQTALWARMHVNEGQFVHAMTVAVLHRPDTKYIQLPAPYELYPYFFFNAEVIQEAHNLRMQGPSMIKGDNKVVHIPANYSGWYMKNSVEMPEQKLNYFIEDIGLNSYYYYFNLEVPFWMASEEFGINGNYRGEQYLYGHKQLLARYYLERLSNDMGEIEQFDWNRPIVTGYYPSMSHQNGMPIPQRQHWSMVPSYKYKYVQDVKEMESRISAAVDSGYIMDVDAKLVNIYSSKGMNLLGNLIEGNADSFNENFYGHVSMIARNILGFSLEPASKYQIVPSALEQFSTSMRDPAFYRLYKRIVNYWLRYKQHQHAYSHDELVFPGVKIESVSVDRLVTYFDHFDTLMNHALVENRGVQENMFIKARQERLNHEPFNFHIVVNSAKADKAVVRLFLGPKYDVNRRVLDISENYMNFYELDQFIVELKAGENKIVRSSNDALFTAADPMCSCTFYEKMMKAMSGGEVLMYNEQVYGFPQRLLLPRGKVEGMDFQLFVYVSHFDEALSQKVDSRVWGKAVFDEKPMGFPLDRPMHAFNFTVDNMFFKDVQIFHVAEMDINKSIVV